MFISIASGCAFHYSRVRNQAVHFTGRFTDTSSDCCMRCRGVMVVVLTGTIPFLRSCAISGLETVNEVGISLIYMNEIMPSVYSNANMQVLT